LDARSPFTGHRIFRRSRGHVWLINAQLFSFVIYLAYIAVFLLESRRWCCKAEKPDNRASLLVLRRKFRFGEVSPGVEIKQDKGDSENWSQGAWTMLPITALAINIDRRFSRY